MVHHFAGPDRGHAEHSQQSRGAFAVEQFARGDHRPDWNDRHWPGCAAAFARTAVDHRRADLNHGAASGPGFQLVWPFVIAGLLVVSLGLALTARYRITWKKPRPNET